MIEPGGEAPDFTLSNQDGEPVSLSGHRGRWVLVCFYLASPRSSVLVDPEGRVARVFPKVKPAEHDDLVLGALRELA